MMLAQTVIVDPFDGPEIAQLIVATIALVGTLASVIIANRGRQHAHAARAQVENDHRTNLRDDQDEIKELVLEVRDKQLEHTEKLEDMAEDVGLLKSGWRTNRDDIDELMDTAAQERRQREMWGPPPATRRERRDRDNAW